MRGIAVEGLQPLLDQFKKLPAGIGSKAKEVFNAWGEQVLDEARTLCPYDPKRKKGKHLRDSAVLLKAESVTKPVALLRFTAPHANLVHEDIAGFHSAEHFSTPGTGPKYLERPFLEKKPELDANIEDAIGKAIDAAT